MDDKTVVVLVIFIFVIGIGGLFLLHEILESDYDKCLDSCQIGVNEQDVPACIIECNNIYKCEEFNKNKDG